MRTTLSVVIVGVGLLLADVSALAHHMLATAYDQKSPVTLKGTITKIAWVNPHGWIHLDVKGADGKVVNWAIETGSPWGLARRGWRKDSLPVGEQVTIEGFLSRNGTPTASGSKVTFADGRSLDCGGHAADMAWNRKTAGRTK